MGKEKFENLFIILIVILIIVGVPYLLYTLGTFIEINNFGYINTWWLVLLFIIVLISIFILGEIDLEKNIGNFFLMLFTIPFFILGIRLGVKSTLDLESYALLLEKEQEIDHLDSILLKLENNFLQLEDEKLKVQTSQNLPFKNHEIIFFKPGSSKLSSFNKHRITTFVSNLENCILNINGHSDGIGNRRFNMNISTERAQTVADFIKSIDETSNTINTVKGFGDDLQLVRNRNEKSRSKNRRVTIEIVGKIDESSKVLRKNIRHEIYKNRTNIKKIKVEKDSLRKIIYQNIER